MHCTMRQQGTTVNVHQMDEAYDALTDYHDRVEQFDPACEHTFSYLQVRCCVTVACWK